VGVVVPRAKKTAGTAIDKRNGQRALLGVVPGLKVEWFAPPEGLCDAAVAAWEAFWVDRQAMLLTPSAKVVLLRWVDALDRYFRTLGDADSSPLVDGSQGQEVLNPLYRVAEQMRATVEACERQLGVGGLNASQLGLAAISEARSLQDMNARYGGAGGDDGDQAEEQDPRRRAIRIARPS
jgi:hypothetical protein